MQQTQENSKTVWYKKIPDPMALIFFISVLVYLMHFFIPAGMFERVVESGKTKVVPNSFRLIEDSASLHVFDIFVAIPAGLIKAGPYLFIVFIAGGLFHILQKTGALENAIGVWIHRMGLNKSNIIITICTFIYGFFGIAVGYENNIALVPIAVLIASAIGRSNLIGAMIAVGGIGVGFALSPISPYTVGVAQTIGELPLFSGAPFRFIHVFSALGLLSFYICRLAKKEEFRMQNSGLSKNLSQYSLSLKDILTLASFVLGMGVMLYGVFVHKWYINQIAAVFIIIAIVIGVINGLGANKIVEQMIEGASGVTAGALVIGLAASIDVLLNKAQMIDTIVYYLSSHIQNVPVSIAAIAASVIQGIINLFIPSGSAQALVTMPILIPVADLIGMSRQLMISAFQIGDGLTNLIIPTSGGTLAMIALAKVSYTKWLKHIFPFMVMVYVLSWGFLLVGYYIGF
ncbi:YfcC family protein [Thorsellia kenyensis]|uniref:YfcC family protein n=1 Tax=Thorsellia kenyensis TaxID=1549888 RepID=A0ABV6CCE3_9GAMM